MARPARPEPKVFCSDEASHRGLRWYRETYFRHAGRERLMGDKSTSYLEDAAAPARAAEVLGEAHILVLLRDPIQRAVSNWRFSTDNGLETRSLETALRDNLSRETPWDPSRSSVSPFAYLERGRYTEYLGPWLTSFPATTHVFLLQDLVTDDEADDERGDRGIGDLWNALEVDPAFRPHSREAVNSSHGEAPPALTAELLGALQTYFEGPNRALSALLGRQLPW